MIQMIPTIMQNAHDKEKLMDMFRAEAENNWDQFVGRLDNSGTYDFSIKLTVSLDSYLSPESGIIPVFNEKTIRKIITMGVVEFHSIF